MWVVDYSAALLTGRFGTNSFRHLGQRRCSPNGTRPIKSHRLDCFSKQNRNVIDGRLVTNVVLYRGMKLGDNGLDHGWIFRAYELGTQQPDSFGLVNGLAHLGAYCGSKILILSALTKRKPPVPSDLHPTKVSKPGASYSNKIARPGVPNWWNGQGLNLHLRQQGGTLKPTPCSIAPPPQKTQKRATEKPRSPKGLIVRCPRM